MDTLKNKPGVFLWSRVILMPPALLAFSIVLVSLMMPGGFSSLDPEKEVISTKDFAGSLEYLGIAITKENTHVWGTSPVIDRQTGKVHLFVAEWDSRAMPFSEGWWHISQIAHYVGDSPEGPFQFVGYVAEDADGTLMNSEGGIGAWGTYGKTANWCGYFGKRRFCPDITEGIVIMNHPDNFGGNCPWLTRDYGHLSPSPFNFREKPTTYAKGESFKLSYRVVLFAGTPQEVHLDAVFKG